MSRKNKYILSIILFMTVLVIDQIIKVNVKPGMYLGERIEITSWFSLVFVENNGMAFGWELWGGKLFLTLFRVVAVVLIGWLSTARSNTEDPLDTSSASPLLLPERLATSSTAFSTDSSSTILPTPKWQSSNLGDMAMASSSMGKWSICFIFLS